MSSWKGNEIRRKSYLNIACVAGAWKLWADKKERDARGRHAGGEGARVLEASRAPGLSSAQILPSACYAGHLNKTHFVSCVPRSQ